MPHTPLKSSRPHLTIAALFAAGLLILCIAAIQLAAHVVWWVVLLLVISILAMTAVLYWFFQVAYVQQEQQQLQLQQLRNQLQQAEYHLQKTNDVHSLLLHHGGQGIFGVAVDGRINFTNPAAENIIGFTSEEMAGKKMHPLIHHHHRNGEDYLEDKCPLYLTLADGVTRYITDELFFCADGTPIDVDYVVAALKDEEKVVGAVVLFNDTTIVRKQQGLLTQRERSLAQAQELAQLGSWRFDVQQRRLECSDECYRILG